MNATKIQTIDQYIAAAAPEARPLLAQMRATIHAAAPDATEKISYGMPTFYLNGNLVHFAAFKNHIGFYPTPGGITTFDKDLAPYKRSKGGVQFPLDKPLPVKLVTKITKYRVKTNQANAKQKSAKSKTTSKPKAASKSKSPKA